MEESKTTDTSQQLSTITKWDILKILVSAGCGYAAMSTVRAILKNFEMPAESIFTKLVYGLGIAALSGTAGAIVSKQMSDDLSDFDWVVNTIKAFREQE